MTKKRAPTRVQVSNNCTIDSDRADIYFPVQYQVVSKQWIVFEDLASFADAIEPLAKRSGCFQNRHELEQYISTVIKDQSQKPKKARDYEKVKQRRRVYSQALDADFL